MAKREKTIFRREHLDYNNLQGITAEASLIRRDLESAYNRYKALANRIVEYKPKYASVIKEHTELAEKYLQFGCSIHTFFAVADISRSIEHFKKAESQMKEVIITLSKEEDGKAE